MNKPLIALLTLVATMLTGQTLAQTEDAAAERARLANQRIHAETERRRREAAAQETEVASSATTTVAAASDTATMADPTTPETTTTATAPTAASASSVTPQPDSNGPAPTTPGGSVSVQPDHAFVLEQLDALGELKDKGYVTDEEFERIKRRLLEGY